MAHLDPVLRELLDGRVREARKRAARQSGRCFHRRARGLVLLALRLVRLPVRFLAFLGLDRGVSIACNSICGSVSADVRSSARACIVSRIADASCPTRT